jgi:hypothetical protein
MVMDNSIVTYQLIHLNCSTRAVFVVNEGLMPNRYIQYKMRLMRVSDTLMYKNQTWPRIQRFFAR